MGPSLDPCARGTKGLSRVSLVAMMEQQIVARHHALDTQKGAEYDESAYG
jgi:hypothetical protein